MPDFNRSAEAQEVFKAKRKPKCPIKFEISLNEEQKRAKEQILNNTVTVLKGKAGSGKSLLAANVALDMLFSREIEKIIITQLNFLNKIMLQLKGNSSFTTFRFRSSSNAEDLYEFCGALWIKCMLFQFIK